MRTAIRIVLCVVAAALVLQSSLAETPAVHWRSGRAVLESGKSLPAPGHVVIQFGSVPNADQRAALREAGITLLTPLGDGAWFAAESHTSKSIPARPEITALSPIRTEWKLHPALLTGPPPAYARVANPYTGTKDVSSDTHWYAVYVMFHRDVDAATAGAVEVMVHEGIVHGVSRLTNVVTAELPESQIPALAEEDSVQWVEPALPALNGQNDQARQATQVDTVQAPPYALSGNGVRVLIYDDGVADETHPDFGGRLTPHDPGPPTTHATHVAGIVGGSGANSVSHGGTAGQWRGMAPGVTLESYAYTAQNGEIPLFTDPGDIESNYTDAVAQYGITLANNSIGVNVYLNTDLPCSLLGDYGVTSALIDALVDGGAGTPLRVVWAAGNERAPGACSANYGSIAPPAGAKNHIAVGAVNSNNGVIASFSSWGPTDDGRIKPDLAAPGTQTYGDLGITSTAPGGGYASLRGTSMSAPMVTGICALLLQDFRLRFPNYNGTGQDPRNATLKAILAQTASDEGPAGPDYQYGFGSVRAKAAVDFLRSGQFLERTIVDGEVITYIVTVAPGDSELKATLAWDDAPAAPNVTFALVNDLDLVAESPSGKTYYPYTLDPSSPGTPAAQTGPDHLNNIEQLRVDLPEAGTWKLRVVGHSVPVEPQTFSLAAAPVLLTCASAGTVSFTREAYPCSGVASVAVADCQLNTDPSVAEIVLATLFSTTDQTGRVVTLTETGPSTAVFQGSFTIGPAETPDALIVSDGDLMTVAYSDMDRGAGSQATVTATATVDCTAPAPANVSVVTTATTARITFDTTEVSRSLVEYGEACAHRNQASRQDRFVTSQTHFLQGLTPDTEYWFTVTATDPAGNASASGSPDQCYTFTTKSRVDFFTEPAVPKSTLANTRLTFTPIDGGSRYSAFRTRNVFYLPTDPSGGETLPVKDDDAARVTLGKAASVVLYGVSYSQFWIGSNGYLDFAQADTSPEATALLHFRDPRVSGLFDDLDPSALTGRGTVSWKQSPDHVAVTWLDVPDFGVQSSSNTFQIRLFFNGVIDITWLNVSAATALSGLSEGKGVDVDFAPSDFSAYPSTGLTLNPIGDRKVDAGSVLTILVGADSNIAPPALTAAHLPAGAVFVDHGGGFGELTWSTNGFSDVGVYSGIQFTASDGVNSASESITIQVGPDPNTPPTVSEAHIVPDGPTTLTPLVAQYVYHDIFERAETGSRMRWFRNDVAASEWDDQWSVPATALTPGDAWYFTIRASNGVTFGDGVRSSAVTVRHVMDLDRNGTVDAIDLQLEINALLGTWLSPSADVNLDGRQDATDLQSLILDLLH